MTDAAFKVPTTTQQVDDWNHSVRELLPDGKHGQELGRIRRQRNATSGPYGYAAWVTQGTMFLGEYPRRQDARAAITDKINEPT